MSDLAKEYEDKENAKSALMEAFGNYFKAAAAFGHSESDEADDIEGVLWDLRKEWQVIP